MAIVTLSNVKKSFGDQDLFADVSFFVNEHERAALIGANGTGKTTILRIICGEVRQDWGTVSTEPGTTVGYLPQDVDLPGVAGLHLAVTGVTPEVLACGSELADLEKKVGRASDEQAQALGSRYAEVSHKFDTLGGFDYQVKARAILLGLGFDESDFDKPVRLLSGGQKTRAALAKLLLLSPDILLLDEPTNHLDIQACEWLQEFLQTRYKGAALIVSHDRYFLDQVVSKVIELENGTVSTYRGNYSAFARQKAAAVEEQQKLYRNQQKEIARIEAAIQTLFSQRKFSLRDSKVKQLERLEQVDRLREQNTISAQLTTTVRSGREVVRLSGLTKSYPGKRLFSDVDFVVERGRKIGIVGPNGSGKTTLLKIIAETETADAGEVMLGHNVKPIYFAQEFDHLVPSRTVLEELLSDSAITAREARDLLARFLFMGDDPFKKVGVLSGGEQCRLALAKVLADRPNLLLLDEPTNHLDITSREALESALRAFDGTALVASHDRYLLDAVATDVVEISEGAFTHYLGGYSRYREKSAAGRRGKSDSASASAERAPGAKDRPVSSLREKERLLRELSKKRKELEETIEQIEARMHEISTALGNDETYRSGRGRDLSREYDELSEKLGIACAEWERVCGQLEAAGSEV